MLYRLATHLRGRIVIGLVAVAAAAIALVGQAAASNHRHRRPIHNGQGVHHGRPSGSGQTGSATGLGQMSGLLPASHLTLESAIQVNLSNETVRLPCTRDRACARESG